MTYATNLLPYLHAPGLQPPLCLSARDLADVTCYSVPGNMSADDGSQGHFRRLLWTQWQLPQLYRRLQADLLFSPIPEAPLASRCRFIVTLHDLIPLRYPVSRSPLSFYCRYYVPRVLSSALHVLCDSEATARDATDRLGIPAAKTTVIPLACDRERFRPLAIEPGNFFLHLGRHDPHKNLARVLRAFAALPRSSASDPELWLAGSGDRRHTPVLKALADELGIATRVRWLDYVGADELPVLLNQAIALVFPSLWEGFGLPVLEAMACGTPVITSNCSSLPEAAGDAALLVDPLSVDELSAALQTIASDRSVQQQLRVRGLQRAAQFSWERTGRETSALLAHWL
ncbi:glycosyltransferase family 4 protein [Rubidibacter lacunae]|nr:glycosyltransferase family 1 protein [Rubidibacter lacunae]